MSILLPLSGMKVVDLASGVAGPMATCRMADLGAEVVKVEFGDGDWTRHCPPMLPDGMSSLFFALNRGKRSVWLDAQASDCRTTLRALVQCADVVVTDLDSAQCEAVGLAGLDDAMCGWHSRLVVAQISTFGREGPLAGKSGSEIAAQAMAGYTRYLGRRGEPSIRLGADVAGCATAIFTVQAVLAALLERARSGQGQRVDLSLLNALLSMKTVHLAAQSDPDSFEGPRVGGAYDPPERGWATADKPITFAFGGAVGEHGRAGWSEFVQEIGLGHMLLDSRYDKNGRLTTGLGPLARTLKPEYEAGFASHSADYVVSKVREHGGFASAYLSHAELMREPQVQALGLVRHVPSMSGVVVQSLDFPARFSEVQISIQGGAPSLGQHTKEVVSQSSQRG